MDGSAGPGVSTDAGARSPMNRRTQSGTGPPVKSNGGDLGASGGVARRASDVLRTKAHSAATDGDGHSGPFMSASLARFRKSSVSPSGGMWRDSRPSGPGSAPAQPAFVRTATSPLIV